MLFDPNKRGLEAEIALLVEEIAKNADILYDSGCYVIGSEEMSLERFCELASELIRENGVEAVIIDGVDAIDDSVDLAYVNMKLKELEVPVIGARSIFGDADLHESILKAGASEACRPDCQIFMKGPEEDHYFDPVLEVEDIKVLLLCGRDNLLRGSIKCFTDGYVFRDPVRSYK